MDVDVSDLRKDCQREALVLADLPGDPVGQSGRSFEEVQAAGLLEPNSINLATANAPRRPAPAHSAAQVERLSG
jgi:hypothetical protein